MRDSKLDLNSRRRRIGKVVFGDGREEDAVNGRGEGLDEGNGWLRRRIYGWEDAGHMKVRVEINETF